MADHPLLGASDCEAITDAYLAQPANAVSSLAFTAVGVAVWVWARAAQGFERHYRVVYGSILAVAGFGSFLYHGPQPSFAPEAHDWSLVALVALIAATTALARVPMRESTRWAASGAAVVASVVAAAVSGSTNAVFAVLAVAAVIADFAAHRGTPRRTRSYAWTVAVAIGAIGSFLLGRTGGAWCDPESALQFHAVWHLLAAVGLGLHAHASEPIRATITSR